MSEDEFLKAWGVELKSVRGLIIDSITNEKGKIERGVVPKGPKQATCEPDCPVRHCFLSLHQDHEAGATAPGMSRD